MLMTSEFQILKNDFGLFVQYLNTLSLPSQFQDELRKSFDLYKKEVYDPSIDFLGGFIENDKTGVIKYEIYGNNEINYEQFDFAESILKIARRYEQKYNTIVMKWYNLNNKIDIRPFKKAINASIVNLDDNKEFKLKYPELEEAILSVKRVLEKLTSHVAKIESNGRVPQKNKIDELIDSVLELLDEMKTNSQNLDTIRQKFNIDPNLQFKVVHESSIGFNATGITDLILYIIEINGIPSNINHQTLRKKIGPMLKAKSQ
jgi:hypothetical protein